MLPVPSLLQAVFSSVKWGCSRWVELSGVQGPGQQGGVLNIRPMSPVSPENPLLDASQASSPSLPQTLFSSSLSSTGSSPGSLAQGMTSLSICKPKLETLPHIPHPVSHSILSTGPQLCSLSPPHSPHSYCSPGPMQQAPASLSACRAHPTPSSTSLLSELQPGNRPDLWVLMVLPYLNPP